MTKHRKLRSPKVGDGLHEQQGHPQDNRKATRPHSRQNKAADDMRSESASRQCEGAAADELSQNETENSPPQDTEVAATVQGQPGSGLLNSSLHPGQMCKHSNRVEVKAEATNRGETKVKRSTTVKPTTVERGAVSGSRKTPRMLLDEFFSNAEPKVAPPVGDQRVITAQPPRLYKSSLDGNSNIELRSFRVMTNACELDASRQNSVTSDTDQAGDACCCCSRGCDRCCTAAGCSVWHALRDLLQKLVHVPCLLFEVVYTAMLAIKVKCKRRPVTIRSISRFHKYTNKSSWVNNYINVSERVWPLNDVRASQRVAYATAARELLVDLVDDGRGALLQQEVDVVCRGGFPVRFGVLLGVLLDRAVPDDVREQSASQMVTQALLAGNQEMVSAALERCPGLTCLRRLKTGPYAGLNPFHVVTLNGMAAMARGLLELLSPADQYSLLHDELDMERPGAGLPAGLDNCAVALHVAVRMGQTEMAELLINHGAELNSLDLHGRNVFHLSVLLVTEDEARAVDMFRLLIRSVPTWLEFTHCHTYLREITPRARCVVASNMLLRAAAKGDTPGTPLKMAAELGSRAMMEAILDIEGVYRFPGLSSREAHYDMTEICPYLNDVVSGRDGSLSVLETLVTKYDDKGLDCLDIPAIGQFADTKLALRQPHIILLSLSHLVIMILYTVTVYYWLLPTSIKQRDDPEGVVVPDNGTTPPSGTPPQDDNLFDTDGYEPVLPDYIIAVTSVFYLVYGLLAAAVVIRMNCRLRLPLRGKMTLFTILQMVTMLFFAVMTLVYVLLKALRNRHSLLCLSLSLLLGWFLTLNYTKAFKTTAFFFIMLDRILFGDILRFLCVIFVVVVGFSVASFPLFLPGSELSTNPPLVMLEYVKLAVGISDFPDMPDSTTSDYSSMAWILYISFLVIANVLLFNLLIAAMSDTYHTISRQAALLCRKVRSADMVVFEAVLPMSLRRCAYHMYQHESLRIKMPDGSVFNTRLHLFKVSLTARSPN